MSHSAEPRTSSLAPQFERHFDVSGILETWKYWRIEQATGSGGKPPTIPYIGFTVQQTEPKIRQY
jgi:hypothetical protein